MRTAVILSFTGTRTDGRSPMQVERSSRNLKRVPQPPLAKHRYRPTWSLRRYQHLLRSSLLVRNGVNDIDGGAEFWTKRAARRNHLLREFRKKALLDQFSR
jgi:hypothetical protein